MQNKELFEIIDLQIVTRAIAQINVRRVTDLYTGYKNYKIASLIG